MMTAGRRALMLSMGATARRATLWDWLKSLFHA